MPLSKSFLFWAVLWHVILDVLMSLSSS
jgi:hypothetical protein